MSTPVATLLFAVFLLGSTLLLGELRWFRREPLSTRIDRYLPGHRQVSDGASGIIRSWQLIAAPLAIAFGAALTRLLGVREPLEPKLVRVHASTSVSEFRLRQLGWALTGWGLSIVVVLVMRPPAHLALVLLAGGPIVGFLLPEHRLQRDARRWQRRVFLEMPVVSEQLGMLLSAGFSVGGALHRLASTGTGTCSRDLQRVCQRIGHGVHEHVALAEWADASGVPAVGRLVGVLALDREASDLGGLIAEESRAVRGEVHRELIEMIERRAQQVWIPVTVATLVPGVLFLMAPFLAAMQLFAGS